MGEHGCRRSDCMSATAESPEFCLLQHLVIEKLKLLFINILIHFHLLQFLSAALELEPIHTSLRGNITGGLIHLVTLYGDFGGFDQMRAA